MARSHLDLYSYKYINVSMIIDKWQHRNMDNGLSVLSIVSI